MKPKQKREKIFYIFSQNLDWVKKHHQIRFEPDFENGYICPLCVEIFFKKDLNVNLKNFLTLEDVPPAALGGKARILTCKKCNSRSGHKLDSHLLNALLEADSKLFLPNSETLSTFEIDGNVINGKIKIDNEGKFLIDFQKQYSNPQSSKEFKKGLFNSETVYNPIFYPNIRYTTRFKSKEITMKFKKTSDERRAAIALLRIAYLHAFSKLGNSFIINNNLKVIREQILNPEKEILPKVFWIKYEFPEDCEGINIITWPKKLNCYLVTFRLITKSISRQFSIALPGPSEFGPDIYKNLEEILCVGDGTEKEVITFETLPDRDYIKDEDLVFGSHYYWQEYTKESYKPRFPEK